MGVYTHINNHLKCTGLNTIIKSQRLPDWIKNDQIVCVCKKHSWNTNTQSGLKSKKIGKHTMVTLIKKKDQVAN